MRVKQLEREIIGLFRLVEHSRSMGSNVQKAEREYVL